MKEGYLAMSTIPNEFHHCYMPLLCIGARHEAVLCMLVLSVCNRQVYTSSAVMVCMLQVLLQVLLDGYTVGVLVLQLKFWMRCGWGYDQVKTQPTHPKKPPTFITHRRILGSNGKCSYSYGMCMGEAQGLNTLHLTTAE